MRSESRAIFGQTDSANSTISESQLTTWANEFYRRVAVKLEAIPMKERSYTLSDTISLNANTVKVNHCKAYVRPSNEWRELKVIDIDELYGIDEDWENADTGEPVYLVRTGTFTAKIHPPLNTANADQADSLKTHGLEHSTALSLDSDIPDLPSNIQDLFPYFMAYKAFLRLSEYDKAAANLRLVQDALKEQKQVSISFSESRGWRWPGDGLEQGGRIS